MNLPLTLYREINALGGFDGSDAIQKARGAMLDEVLAVFERHGIREFDTHAGWDITPNFIGWQATHPDYEPGDRRYVTADTREGVIAEIERFIEEYGS